MFSLCRLWNIRMTQAGAIRQQDTLPVLRYGTPCDLMALIDRCHMEGIGVIMEIVPSNFPKDDYGLYKFDGTCLYEDNNPKKVSVTVGALASLISSAMR